MRTRSWVVLGLVGLGLLSPLPREEAYAVDIPGVVYNPGTGTYYKLYTSLVPWAEARQTAASLGGHLATITSASENAWVLSNMGLSADAWLGASDEASEGTWVWVTGETWSYTNWNAGEPNDSGNEDYCSMRPDGLWNDLRSTHTRGYIVEWEEDPNGPPEAPTNLVATAGSEQAVDLTWDDNSTRESGFEIERSVAGGAFEQIATRGTNAKAYTDTDLIVETAYAYRVRAVGSGGASDYTNVASLVSASPPVQDLVGTPLSSTTVALEWTDVASQETGFRVERGNGASASVFSTLATLPANSVDYTDTTGTAESTYTYRVRALGPDGSPSSSPNVVVTTYPGAPAYFGVSTPDGPNVLVEWQDSSTTKTHFEIERRTTSPVTAWTPLATAGALMSSYEDATVAPETAYEYRMRVGNASGASEWSAPEQITTPPHPPEDFVGESLSTNHVRLTWTDRAVYESGFMIMRAELPEGPFELLAITPRNATSYDDTNVSQEGRYAYRIAATWALGRSEWVTTDPDVELPAALTIDSFVIKPGKTKGKKVKPGRVDVRGAFDTGDAGLGLGGPTTIRVGDTVVDIPGLELRKKLLQFDDGGTRLTVLPGNGASRATFTLRLTGDAADALDPEGEVSGAYATGEFAAQGSVHLASGRYQPARSGHVVTPVLDVSALGVRLSNGQKDRLKAKGVFDASAGTPETPPTVGVDLGVLSFRSYPTNFSRKGDRWTYSEKVDNSTRKVVVDYAKGQITISLSGIDVGPFPQGSEPVTVTVLLDDMLFVDTPVLANNGKSMGY